MSGTRGSRRSREASTECLPFRVDAKHTPTNAILNVRDVSSRGNRNYRKLAAFIYRLAADLEEQSEAVGARWAIVPEPSNAWIIIEIERYADREAAWRFADDIVAVLDRRRASRGPTRTGHR